MLKIVWWEMQKPEQSKLEKLNMANIARFKSGQTPEYLTSVHTPDYEGDPDVIVNPNISAVQNIDRKYWKRVGNTIVEMTASEKQAVLDAELAQRKTTADDFGIDIKIALTALIKVINQRLPTNKITKQEMIDALKVEIV